MASRTFSMDDLDLGRSNSLIPTTTTSVVETPVARAEPEAPKSKASPKEKHPAGRRKNGSDTSPTVRATFIVDVDQLEQIKQYAYTYRTTQRGVIKKALAMFFEANEDKMRNLVPMNAEDE